MSTRHPLVRQLHSLMNGSAVAPHHGRHLSFFDIEGQDRWMLAVPHDVLASAPAFHYGATGAAGVASPDGDTLTWVWPWDIVAFLKNAGSTMLGLLANHPHKVCKLTQDISASGRLTPEAADPLRTLDETKFKTFFKNLGNHPEFKADFPNAATLLRGLGGEQIPSVPTAEPIPENQKVLRILMEVAKTVGVIVTIGAAALGLILAIVGAAVALAPIFGITTMGTGAVILIGVAIGLILLVLAGSVIAVVVAIIELVMKGILIVMGASPVGGELSLDRRVTLALAERAAP